MHTDWRRTANSILDEHLPGRHWHIERPQTGWRKESYVASSSDARYFLKFDVPTAMLKRLGEIEVAPRVLFAGDLDGRTYVIQEFITGTQPGSKHWMRAHADQLAAIIRTYHEDQQLRQLLAPGCASELRQHISQDLGWLSQRFQRCGADYLQTPEIQQGVARLSGAASGLLVEPLVPVHNDPSPTNILLVGGRFVFLDWDEATLSDPMRDIGLLLWWNFPPEQWSVFFERYGLELTGPRKEKIYWFAARAGLDIALWHAEQGADGTAFAEDFLAAVDQQPNPKGY